MIMIMMIYMKQYIPNMDSKVGGNEWEVYVCVVSILVATPPVIDNEPRRARVTVIW